MKKMFNFRKDPRRSFESSIDNEKPDIKVVLGFLIPAIIAGIIAACMSN